MKVRDIMSAPVITVTGKTTLFDVAKIMVERRIGGVPVVRGDGRLVGIVTESDFCGRDCRVPFSLLRVPQLFGEWVSSDNLERIYEQARTVTAAQVMTRDPVTVNEDDPVDVVAELMCRNKVHRLPVIRADMTVGIVPRHDLLTVMLRTSPRRAPGASASPTT